MYIFIYIYIYIYIFRARTMATPPTPLRSAEWRASLGEVSRGPHRGPALRQGDGGSGADGGCAP